MTDQFSQEYIDYILKAKALQALWEPAVGDWVYGSRYERRMHMVIESRTEHEVEVVTGVGCDGVQTPKTYRNHDGVLWLPTLFQLIRVIEGARYWWRWRLAYDGEKRYEMRIGKLKGHGQAWDSADDDLMLAAAQLAVRAVEGK